MLQKAEAFGSGRVRKRVFGVESVGNCKVSGKCNEDNTKAALFTIISDLGHETREGDNDRLGQLSGPS